MLFVDSDNALGSTLGDVNDGFALAYLLNTIPHLTIASIWGNTSEAAAFRNISKLSQMLDSPHPVLHGCQNPTQTHSEAVQFLTTLSEPIRLLALGPLTNIAMAMKASPQSTNNFQEIICIGGNPQSRGKWPPYWPHDFNLTQDRDAFSTVFHSSIPITLIPMPLGRRLHARRQALKVLPAPIQTFFLKHTQLRFWRNTLLKLSATLPLWDLIAAIYVTHPELFQTTQHQTHLHRNGWLEFDSGHRSINTVTNFGPKALWKVFHQSLENHFKERSQQIQKI